MLLILLLLLTVKLAKPSVLTYQDDFRDTYVRSVKLGDIVNNNFNMEAVQRQKDIVFNAVLTQPLPIYSLDLVKIKEIYEIDIECYDIDNCPQELSDKEMKLLTVYASMVEICGKDAINDLYSIGLIRALDNENLMGRFSKSYNQLTGVTEKMSFWIRLSTGIGRNQMFVHDDLGDYALTVSILEMAIHERSHYDVTSYNPQEGHCDGYQAWYNSLMQDAVHKLDKYKRLTDFIMGTADNTNWYIIVTCIAFFMLIVGIVVAFAMKKKPSKRQKRKDTKQSDIETPLNDSKT